MDWAETGSSPTPRSLRRHGIVPSHNVSRQKSVDAEPSVSLCRQRGLAPDRRLHLRSATAPAEQASSSGRATGERTTRMLMKIVDSFSGHLQRSQGSSSARMACGGVLAACMSLNR